jgi:hypothetical protein
MPILGIMASQISGHLAPSSPVAGYSVWLDASDTATITQSGGAVSQWTDKSVSAYAFTQATSGLKPTTGSTQNGKNVLTFDSGDRLGSTAAASTWTFLSNNTQWTAFYAFNMANSNFATLKSTNGSTSSNTGTVVAFNDATVYSLRHMTSFGSGGQFSILNDTVTNAFTTAFTYVTLLSDVANATAANRSDIRIKQGSAIQNNTRTGSYGSTPTYTLELGMTTGIGAYGFDGKLGEILIYNSTLSAGNILLNQQYLAGKWGV